MGSTITAATADLYARLVAVSALAAVQITFGPPAAHEEQEVIALMGVLDASEEWASLGAQRREETYNIELGVKVHDPTADPDSAATVFARSRVLVDAIETAIHATTAGRTLGATVRDAHVTSTRTDGILPADGGGYVVFWRVLVSSAARNTA